MSADRSIVDRICRGRLTIVSARSRRVTGQVTAGGIDGGSVLTAVGVAAGSTALLTGMGFFLIRRRRDATERSRGD